MNVSASAVAVTVSSFSHLCINDSLQRGRNKCWFNRDLTRNLVLRSSTKRKLCEYPRFNSIKCQQTYTSEITTLADMPLYESPHASFDRYMEDKPRVFKAIFPENRGTQRLNETKWDLEGVTEGSNKPSEFRINMDGILYPERKGARSRIKGHFHMSLSFSPPPILALVPPHVHQDVTQSVMKNMAENMKHKVSDNLLADYTKFKKENPKHSLPR